MVAYFRIISFIRRHKIMFVIIVIADIILTFMLLRKDIKSHFIEKSKLYLSQYYPHDETDVGIIDIHHENRLDNISSHHHQHLYQSNSDLTTIAIGLALTSAGVTTVSKENIHIKIPFLRTLFPSFCKTSTQGYSYHFYVAFDKSDPLFTDQQKSSWFTGSFSHMRRTRCSYVSEIHLHMIECEHNKKPAWAQNDAMMEAFLDNMEYYYRVNDDTVMKSTGWTELYISTLMRADPPNVGVVGPKHEGGNHDILTYDFVHRKHIEIFGFYYPRIFTDWFADNWITEVYLPNRTVKLRQVKVVHTQSLGKRYSTHFDKSENLHQQLHNDQHTLNLYLTRLISCDVKTEKTFTVSFTLSSFHLSQVYGVIRNIHLIRLYLPQWTIHVYIRHHPKYSEKGRVHQKLVSLNVTVHYIQGFEDIPDKLLGYLVADEVNVERFIVRDVVGRISERDICAVEDWILKDKDFHCMRDHPNHKGLPMVPGLWGAKHSALMQALGATMKRTLQEYFVERNLSRAVHEEKPENIRNTEGGQAKRNFELSEETFLRDVIWPKVKNNVLCHDSLFCDIWHGSVAFPSKPESQRFVGMKYYAFEMPEVTNASSKVNTRNYHNDKCS